MEKKDRPPQSYGIRRNLIRTRVVTSLSSKKIWSASNAYTPLLHEDDMTCTHGAIPRSCISTVCQRISLRRYIWCARRYAFTVYHNTPWNIHARSAILRRSIIGLSHGYETCISTHEAVIISHRDITMHHHSLTPSPRGYAQQAAAAVCHHSATDHCLETMCNY